MPERLRVGTAPLPAPSPAGAGSCTLRHIPHPGPCPQHPAGRAGPVPPAPAAPGARPCRSRAQRDLKEPVNLLVSFPSSPPHLKAFPAALPSAAPVITHGSCRPDSPHTSTLRSRRMRPSRWHPASPPHPRSRPPRGSPSGAGVPAGIGFPAGVWGPGWCLESPVSTGGTQLSLGHNEGLQMA